MYKFFSVFCILVCAMLMACEQSVSQPSVPQQKIGVVNINRILVDSEAGRAATKYMENLQNSLRTQATALQEKLQKAAEGAEGSDGKADPKKEEAQAALQKEIQMEYVRLQGKLQAEQQNVNNILNDVVHRTVDSFRKANGYALIVFSDLAISFEDNIDVTSGVIQAMNKEKVEFKPVETPAAPPKAKTDKEGKEEKTDKEAKKEKAGK